MVPDDSLDCLPTVMVLNEPSNLIISDCEVSDTYMVPAFPVMTGCPD